MATMLTDITTNSPHVPEDKMSPDEMNEWSIDAMKELVAQRKKQRQVCTSSTTVEWKKSPWP